MYHFQHTFVFHSSSMLLLPFLLASCLTSLLSLRSYVHKHKPETIFQYSFYHLFSLSSGINDPQTVFTLVVVCITVLLLLARVCFGMFKKFGPHKVVVRPYLVDRALLLLLIFSRTEYLRFFFSFSQKYGLVDDVCIPVSSAFLFCFFVVFWKWMEGLRKSERLTKRQLQKLITEANLHHQLSW